MNKRISMQALAGVFALGDRDGDGRARGHQACRPSAADASERRDRQSHDGAGSSGARHSCPDGHPERAGDHGHAAEHPYAAQHRHVDHHVGAGRHHAVRQ